MVTGKSTWIHMVFKLVGGFKLRILGNRRLRFQPDKAHRIELHNSLLDFPVESGAHRLVSKGLQRQRFQIKIEDLWNQASIPEGFLQTSGTMNYYHYVKRSAKRLHRPFSDFNFTIEPGNVSQAYPHFISWCRLDILRQDGAAKTARPLSQQREKILRRQG